MFAAGSFEVKSIDSKSATGSRSQFASLPIRMCSYAPIGGSGAALASTSNGCPERRLSPATGDVLKRA